MPSSETASTKPVADTAPDTTTAVSGGENEVAFSSNSARRCATSDTARPETARSSSIPTSSTRGKSAISAAAARTTSSSAIGCCHWRGCSAPESTSRLSALRRMRVAMWSSLNERVERRGVVLVALEIVEQLQLPFHQALVAAGQVHEEVAHALAQQPRLLVRDLDGDRLHVVEGLGELADLILRRDLDARRLHVADVTAGAERLDQCRQLPL